MAALVTVLLCVRAENRYIHSFADEFGDLKLQGVALQKAAFTQSDLLVIYGSSELLSSVHGKAGDFFKYQCKYQHCEKWAQNDPCDAERALFIPNRDVT